MSSRTRSIAARLKASIGASAITRRVRCGWLRAGKGEERLPATGQRALIGRTANIDVDDEALAIAMGEPGRAVRTFPDDVGARRRDQELVRQSPAREVAPGLRAASEPRPARPAFGDEDRRAALIPHALGRREIRSDAGERAQRLADLAEIEGSARGAGRG